VVGSVGRKGIRLKVSGELQEDERK
jgi:hypothetical protein